MLLRIRKGGRVTLPGHVLQAMGVQPGEHLRLDEGPDGHVLRPHRIDLSRLAPLRAKLRPGTDPCDVHAFRTEPHDQALRD